MIFYNNYMIQLKLYIMTKSSKMALGFLGAVTAGLVIGLLIAPEKGSKTRKKIKNKTADWADAVGNICSKSADGAKRAMKRQMEMPSDE
jgi:gas vesicle protein